MSRARRFRTILIRPARTELDGTHFLPLYAVNSPVVGSIATFTDKKLADATVYLLNEEQRAEKEEVKKLLAGWTK